VAGCKQRCVDTSGCNYYNSFSNGGCHISTGDDGTEINSNPTTSSGSKYCNNYSMSYNVQVDYGTAPNWVELESNYPRVRIVTANIGSDMAE
jgi:hypothetical protein